MPTETTTQEKDAIDILPPEIWTNIFNHLLNTPNHDCQQKVKTINNLRQTCRLFLEIIRGDTVLNTLPAPDTLYPADFDYIRSPQYLFEWLKHMAQYRDTCLKQQKINLFNELKTSLATHFQQLKNKATTRIQKQQMCVYQAALAMVDEDPEKGLGLALIQMSEIYKQIFPKNQPSRGCFCHFFNDEGKIINQQLKPEIKGLIAVLFGASFKPEIKFKFKRWHPQIPSWKKSYHNICDKLPLKTIENRLDGASLVKASLKFVNNILNQGDIKKSTLNIYYARNRRM